MKITCMAGGYNEAKRLFDFLDHATKWSDEIIYVDKSSEDSTVELCNSRGVKVISVPFTPAGKENMGDYMHHARNDWVFVLTPGETPTRQLISEVHKLLDAEGDKVDLVSIPKKLYSFGIHEPKLSPWSVSYQPFLVNRKRAKFSPKIHQNFSLKEGGKGATIPYSETCHVLHPTHATVEGFLRSHIDYILASTDHRTDYEQMIREAFINMNQFNFGGPRYDLIGQHSAWNLYWSGVALAAFEKQRAKDVPAQYRAITEAALKEWL